MRGMFPIALTPFDGEGRLLWPELERECDWLVRSGAHGVVWPVNDSEFSVLSSGERLEGMRRVAGAVDGRVPCVLGVADVCTAGACDLAEAAARVGASAVIAMPPWNVKLAGVEQFVWYYGAIAEAAGVPVVVQNLGGQRGSNLSAATLQKLCESIPLVQYVKEERHLQAERISELTAFTGEFLKGVFSGGWVLNLTAAHRRGCCGVMQGSAIPEVMARIWDLMEAGDEKAARAIEQKVNVFEAALFAVQTIQGVKEVLVRRGIFSSSALRGGEPRRLDADLMHDLDAALELLRSWLKEPAG